MLFKKMPKLFGKKNAYVNKNRHNHALELQKSAKVLNIRRIQRARLLLDNYMRMGQFTHAQHEQTVFKMHAVLNLPQKAQHYIALHTAYGLFYVYNGIEWLHNQTSIYIEHENDDMQKWLLSRAFDELPKNSFLADVNNMHVHQYIRTKEYECFYINGLNGLKGRPIYANIDTWNRLFKTCQFASKNTYTAIDEICIHKPILFGKQSITRHDYNKLVCGNVILLNETAIQGDGLVNIALGGFILKSIYENGRLVFQEWDRNMNNKTYNDNEEENEEWEDAEEETLDNAEYSEEEDTQDNYDNDDNDEEDIQDDSEYDTDDDDMDEEYATEDDAYHDDGYEAHDTDDAAEAAQNASNSHQTQNAQENVAEDAHPFANVPIQLVFSLGSLRMPIGQILQLQEGSVIELHKSTPAQVQIYANKRLIGGGEVVEIDGKLGVQISHLQQNT
jgi:type III secretion system YscQ/HrcQ family protein